MTDASAWREASAALAEYACGYDAGRTKDDPVYTRVTEGRDVGAMRKHYSSCGDLGHWILWQLGCRQPWVNRNPNGGWRVGENISLLAKGKPPTDPTWKPERGAILLVWTDGANNAHCCVALALAAGTLQTANYGAGGMSATASPGARIGSAALRFTDGRWFYGLRRVQRVIDPAAWLPGAAAPDLTGAALPGEVLDALAADFAAARVGP